MPRCNSCEKMVGYEAGEPEMGELEVALSLSNNGDQEILEVAITGEITITATCAECGDELRQGTIEVNETEEFELGELPELVVEWLNSSIDELEPEVEEGDITSEIGETKKRKTVETFGNIEVKLFGIEIASIRVNDTTLVGEMDEL